MAATWNGDAAKRLVRERAAKALLAAAATLVAEHKRDLSTSYPPASRAGEFPHGRTWNLRSAVDSEPKSVAEVAQSLRVRVGYRRNAEYILYLVKAKRSWLLDTARRIQDRLRAMLAGVGGTVRVGGNR